MKNRAILDAIALIAVGVMIIAYAHANFASKTMVEKMDDRIYDIWEKVAPEKAAKETR